ncbi:hypothetical protein [Winogradskyella pacifica]|uniref:T9SS C-terminal target domain-containing protein n=1 Tax=Winogradskyella pacifica TaxID=664642 RepID=A0A3D9MAQ9_9FLAO|nr:hypothetical protein [Winogradskyella pacifica]REE16911.1 hypothetical protein DFQ09_105123 [Winogradskyella pacifica]
MKTTKNLFFLLAFSLIAFNCSSDDDNTTDDDGGNTNDLIQKSGILTEDETWTSNNIYQLNGKVVVNDGVTLTIEAGTIIKGAEGQESLASALVVDQGGKVMAEGTASNPIIMTSILDNITVGQTAGTNLNQADTGYWGGLIILGRAPISVSGDVETAQIEGIPATEPYGQYGGTISNDNSGVYKYISVRHGGITIGDGNEINGITMGGVGNGTTMENLEVVANQDDGFEWFGGTVNGTNFITWAHGDDGLDADQSWSGTMTNAVVIQTSESGSPLELDGPEGSAATEAGYTFNNITLIGDAATSHFTDCRDGLIANLNNILVYNFGATSDIRFNDEDTQTELAADRLTFSNWEIVLPTGVALADIIDGANGNEAKFSDNVTTIENSAAATVGANTTVFGWTYAASQNAF